MEVDSVSRVVHTGISPNGRIFVAFDEGVEGIEVISENAVKVFVVLDSRSESLLITCDT